MNSETLLIDTLNLTAGKKPFKLLQGDHSGRLQPPVDLVPTVLAASGPLLQLPTAQAG